MRYHIVAILFFTLLGGCIELPIEIDCGLECEDTQPAQQDMQTYSNSGANQIPTAPTYMSQPVYNNTGTAEAQPQQETLEQVATETIQTSITASKDWKELAAELANQINNELITKNYIDTSVYVKPTCSDPNPCDQDTALFVQTFKEFLITELVRYGVPTVDTPEANSVQVAYHVRVVRHFQKQTNSFSSNISRPLADEIIITTSILSENKYIFRETGVYTINDKDFWHYQDMSGEATRIPVASRTKYKEIPVKKNTTIEVAPPSTKQNI